MMYKQALHENWRMREAGGEWQEARVPELSTRIF